MHNVNALPRRCRGLHTTVSVLHTQLLAHPEAFAGHTRVCGGYTRPFAEATRSRSRGLTLDYVNDIQARKSHKSVNCMELNGIRVGQTHNVNALHRRLYPRFCRGYTQPFRCYKNQNTCQITEKYFSNKQ